MVPVFFLSALEERKRTRLLRLSHTGIYWRKDGRHAGRFVGAVGQKKKKKKKKKKAKRTPIIILLTYIDRTNKEEVIGILVCACVCF